MGIIQAIFVFLRAFIIGRAAAAAEILALRQQLAVCRQSIKRPKLRPRDRILALLDHVVAKATVAKYMVRTRKPPSQTWRTFLDNHVADIAACDFFTVPTVAFRVLYVFIVLCHERRQIVHFNITILDRNSPTPREVEPSSLGEVVSIPMVGGLHHQYTHRAA